MFSIVIIAFATGEKFKAALKKYGCWPSFAERVLPPVHLTYKIKVSVTAS
jgi:hypothetical protein